MAMISLLPIMIQQAASFSYDGVLMGIVFLFISICIYLMKEDNAGTKWYVLCALAALYLLLNKGAVYLPIALIMFLIKKPQALQKITLSRNKKIAILLVVVAVAAIVAVTRFMPILSNIALAGEASQGPDDKLSLGYLIGHPLLVVRLFWNTIFDSSDKLFLGALGGVLGWHNKVVVAFLPVLNLLGLILLSNASDDEKITGKLRGLFLAAGVLSMGMISLAMMLAETTYSSKAILGLQGRYFVPQMLLIIIALVGGVFQVDKKRVPGIMAMMLGVDAFIMLQVFAGVL